MTPPDFITKWGPGGPAHALNERQGAQPHFIDLCQLLGVSTPGSAGDYIFEQDTLVLGEARGYADVFYRDHFAWENKAPGKNLDMALKQLLTYSLALSNPPLLVVCDRLTIRIHTQFNGHPSEVHTVLLAELDQPAKQALLRRLWTDPESFRPKKTSRDITEAAAKSFATLAEGLRKRNADADEVAHFLTQCLFCFFAEDVGLLPERMFEGLVKNKNFTSEKLTQGLTNLFTVMRDGGLYGNDDIPWFNGGLFKKVKVPRLSIMEMTELRNAAALNWSAIDVSIFGTLFERGLDPAKRSQLGAHYTDPATILRIVEPVLTRPLLQKWELLTLDLRALMAKSTKKGDKHYKAAQAKFVLWLEDLKAYRLLDPACGSGNFLFLGLKALKDIEHKSHLDAASLGLDREADLVTGPHNVLGLELNEYAAELARVTVWIGELQWRMAHGYEFKTNPVLEPLDHIECRDALLSFGAAPNSAEKFEDARNEPGARAVQTPGPHTLRFLKSGPTSAPPTPLNAAGLPSPQLEATEAPWPQASVVIGNPPFLGGSKKRRELGDDYFKALDSVFAGRVPGGADLVCYWFDKARLAIESGQLLSAGLVATQAIRAGANRTVLDRLLEIPDSAHNSAHGNHHIRHTSVGRAIAHGGNSSGTSRGRGEGDSQKPGQPGDPAGFGSSPGSPAYRSGGAQVDDGPDDRRGHVPGAQNLLLATPSISIFNAWADEPWVNNGAAVRVSLVCFGVDAATSFLNGQVVQAIHADLTGGDGLDLTLAQSLNENDAVAFKGAEKSGSFEIHGSVARAWLACPNPHGHSNAEVLCPWLNGSDLADRPKGHWVIDFGVNTPLMDAAMFEKPFDHINKFVKPEREKNNDRGRRENWWRFGRNGADMRQGISGLKRFVATPRVAKHRIFSWLFMPVSADSRLLVITRADDTTFGILSSRVHEVWSLAQASVHGDGADGGRPTYNAKSCFETFPFPAGLTPQDTAHQQTEILPDGAVIPANIYIQNRPLTPVQQAQEATKSIVKSASKSKASEVGLARMSGAASNGEAYEAPASEPTPPGEHTKSAANGIENALNTELRAHATVIAQAAKKLNDLRENWLNPPEWTHKVPEVTPLGLDKSPYPDRIEPKPGINEQDFKALQKRTLTNLYNAKPAWLTLAHQQLDMAVAAAYGWADYTAAMPDDEILKRLLALNLARACSSARTTETCVQ